MLRGKFRLDKLVSKGATYAQKVNMFEGSMLTQELNNESDFISRLPSFSIEHRPLLKPNLLRQIDNT